MSDNTQVLIVDDHPMLRKGLMQVIADDPALEIAGEGGTAEEALAIIGSARVDVAVLDIDLPKMNGLELAKRIWELQPGIRIVLLTIHDSEEMLNAAIDLGVSAYLLKDEADAGIIEGIKSAAKNQTYVTPSLARYLMRRGRRSSEFRRQVPGIDSLTRMERTVLRRVAEKKTTKEIAKELFVSDRTIETHRANICSKLGLTGNNALLLFALEHKSEVFDLPE